MFDMMWIYEPSAWIGLLTLVVLEIVLGIDNLLFIAILASKLPLKLQDKARYLGLGLALLTRLCLIAAISWVVTLNDPVLSIGSLGLSVRDLILIVGGLFLLFKSTSELHEKLEGRDTAAHASDKAVAKAFGMVVLQIVVHQRLFFVLCQPVALAMCHLIEQLRIELVVLHRRLEVDVSLSNHADETA